MFAPDQCNADKRTHLIFSRKGKNYLKKPELPYKQEGEGVSHLYRLVLKPDSTVRVEVDQVELYAGSLKDDWDMLPAKEIPDANDKKPADWVEDSMMVDPDDKKPADWVDEKRLVDSSSSKPDEWDDEEDGEWEPPHVENPAFKGEWVAKRITNPAYKGAWEAKKIPNPDFTDDPQLYMYKDFGYVGFDVYQVKGGTIFDNVIITDSIAEADAFAAKWKKLSDLEKAKQKEAEDESAAKFEKARAARAARAAAAKAAEEAANATKAKAAEDAKNGEGEDSKPAEEAQKEEL
jgi:calreticulin